jgi:hypothetical protein
VKITLSKKIEVRKFEFVGELDFFETSPYITLLEGLETKEDLIELLKEKDIPLSAIKNVIQKLEELKVLKDGMIINVEDGFPEKEYGKYAFTYFENDTKKPFKYLAENIRREKAVSKNTADNILQLDRDVQNFIENKHKTFNGKETFEIIEIEKNKGLLHKESSKNIDLVYEDEKWNYIIDSKKFSMENIDLNVIFWKQWDKKYDSFQVEYAWIEKNIQSLQNFKISFQNNNHKVGEYGEFTVSFENIPIIPKTEDDALKWFIALLKIEIENENRYISKDELKQLWLNLKDKKPKFKKFDLEFDFKMILNEFGKNSKYYWLLQAGIDLYPFDNSLASKPQVTIKAQKDIDLDRDFFQKFHIEYPNELTIVDRWIVNLDQYRGLEKIIEAFGNPKVTIITQKVKDKKNNKLIEKIIERCGIKVIQKDKKDIVHQRYWIFDNEHIYQTSESFDFIKINNEKVDVGYTTFLQFEKKDLDPKLLSMEMK